MITMNDIPATVANIYSRSTENDCIHARETNACAEGTQQHPDSKGNCCAACDYAGYLYEAQRASVRGQRSLGDITAMLEASHDYEDAMREAAKWKIRMDCGCAGDCFNCSALRTTQAPAPYPFVRKMGNV